MESNDSQTGALFGQFYCAQSSPALSDPMDCSPPGPSVHRLLQERILEASLVAQMVDSACNAGHRGSVPVSTQEDPVEKGMATHSSILAWRIPRTEEPGKLQS